MVVPRCCLVRVGSTEGARVDETIEVEKGGRGTRRCLRCGRPQVGMIIDGHQRV